LFLASWEVNIQSGQEQGKEQEHDKTEKGLDKPTYRWRYLLFCFCYHYFVVFYHYYAIFYHYSTVVYHYFVVVVYSWFIPGIRKSLKEISKLKFKKPLFSLSPENNQSLHMVSNLSFKIETWA
jgi:hypothetical protein